MKEKRELTQEEIKRKKMLKKKKMEQELRKRKIKRTKLAVFSTLAVGVMVLVGMNFMGEKTEKPMEEQIQDTVPVMEQTENNDVKDVQKKEVKTEETKNDNMVRHFSSVGSLEIMTDKYKLEEVNRVEIRSKENPEVFALITREERKSVNDKRSQQSYAYIDSEGYGKPDQIKISEEPAFYKNIYREFDISNDLFKNESIFAFYVVDKELRDSYDHSLLKRYIVYQVIENSWYKFIINIPPNEDENKYLEDYWTMFNTFETN